MSEDNQSSQSTLDLSEATNFLNERENASKIREVEEFFTLRLREKRGMLEQECECLFYLLRAKLKKHTYFETIQCSKLRQELFQKTRELEKQHVAEFKQAGKNNTIAETQMRAFFDVMEYYYGALEEDYERLRFVQAQTSVFEEKMRFRQHMYFVKKDFRNWFMYYLYDITSSYGNSMIRWFTTSLVTIGIFSILFFLLDKLPGEKIVDLAGKSWHEYYDYFYYSIVTFTTLGYGDILPHTLLQKVFVSFEVVTGYVMLGIFMNLIGKRI